MPTTVTWEGGSSGDWFAALNWSSFSVPTAADDVVISGATVTIDGAAAAATDISLLNGATLDVAAALALGGTFSGGTLDLAGTLSGGTLTNTSLVGQGGTLEGVTVAGSLTSLAIGYVVIDPATAASFGPTITVYGTLSLLPGLYDNVTFAGSGLESLAAVGGAATLGPHALVQGLAGLSGDLVNRGNIGGGGARTSFAIGGGGFTNDGTFSLTPVSVSESYVIAPNVYHWTQSTGPSVTIASATADNAGLIALVGGTLAFSGADFVNTGTIALTDGTTQVFVNNGSNPSIETEPLFTAVTIGAPFTQIDNTGTISADRIDFAGPVAFSSLGTLKGALQFDNVLDLGGATLDASSYGSVLIDGLVENGTLKAGTGTLILQGATLGDVTIAAGGSVVIDGPIVLDGVPTGASQVVLGGTTSELILPDGSRAAGVVISAGGPVTDTLDVSGGSATLAPTASLVAAGSSFDMLGAGTLENDGVISVASGVLTAACALDGTGTVVLAAATTLTDAVSLGGSLIVSLGSGAVLGAATVTDSVDITVAAGGKLDIGTLEGNATITVDAGARVTIDALSGTPTVAFAGAPSLVVLPGTGALPVTLRNLAAGDLIDFVTVSSIPAQGFGAGGAAVAGGSLDVTGASGDTARVALQNQATALDFSTTIDGLGGTLVTAACFCAGTRLATARGEVPVERLRRGDLVRTASGHLRPIIWLGRRRIDCRRHPRPAEVWPVRVQAHAFAPGRPARTLHLSPDHAVWLDGVLIPVRYLLNGASIAQFPVARVDYWHVELPAHDVLLAEGLPAESYLDTGNRAAFEGAPRRPALHPAAALRIWRSRACAPLLTAGPRLAAAHARLLARSRRLGHALTAAPMLRVLADGRPAKPLGGLRFRLPEGARAIRLLSRSFVPAHLAGHGDDPRRLGIAVGRIRLDDTTLRLDDPRLGAGWHAPEPDWRWTAGDAAITAAGARELAIELAITGRYWRA